MNGNDKLKHLGFHVHGCIDGFRRKIIWLHVTNINEDPAAIAHYFLKEVEVIDETATKIRAENCIINFLCTWHTAALSEKR